MPRTSLGNELAFTCAPVNVSASTTAAELVAAPAAGYAIWVYSLGVTVSTAATLTFRDGAASPVALSGAMILSAGPLHTMAGIVEAPIMKCTAAKALNLVSNTAADVDGMIVYAIAKA